jgi:hypothetical protein
LGKARRKEEGAMVTSAMAPASRPYVEPYHSHFNSLIPHDVILNFEMDGFIFDEI